MNNYSTFGPIKSPDHYISQCKDNLYFIRDFDREGGIIKFGYSKDLRTFVDKHLAQNPLASFVMSFYREDGLEIEAAISSIITQAYGSGWYREEHLKTIIGFINNGIPSELQRETYDNIGYPAGFKKTVVDLHSLNRTAANYGRAFGNYPFLKKALDILGFQGIEELDYHIPSIKTMLTSEVELKAWSEILKGLQSHEEIKEGNFVTAKLLKVIFTKVYAELKLPTTGKAVDIYKYYHVQKTKRYITVEDKFINACGFVLYGAKIQPKTEEVEG